MNLEETKVSLRNIQSKGYDWIQSVGDLIKAGKLVEAGNKKNEGFELFDKIGEIQNAMTFNCPEQKQEKPNEIILDSFSIDQTNPSQITANIDFHVDDGSGGVLQSQSQTNWGLTGDGMPFNHFSVGPFGNHTQPLPTFNTSNTTNSGSYLVEGETYEYQIVSTLDDGTVCTSPVMTFQVPVVQGFVWDNTETPPVLDTANLTCIDDLSQMSNVTYDISDNSFHVKGPYYLLTGTGDLFVDARQWGKIFQPVWFVGFRHVIILGLDIEAVTAVNGAVGQSTIWSSGQGALEPNVHPYVQSNRLLHVEISGTCWIEGLHSQAKGHSVDHLVTNGLDTQSDADIKANRKTKFINSRTTGHDGVAGYSGQGIHADTSQNQDFKSQASLVSENHTSKTSYSHHTTANGGASPYGHIKFRNFMTVLDPVYGADQSGGGIAQEVRPDNLSSACGVHRPEVWEVENWIGQPESEAFPVMNIQDFGLSTQQYVYAPVYSDGTATNHPTDNPAFSVGFDRNELIQVKGGWQNNSFLAASAQAFIEANDPAPEAFVGLNYVSPWQSTYDTYCN